MRKVFIISLLILTPVLAMAQTSGGQISRKNNVTNSTRKQPAKKTLRGSTTTNIKVINVSTEEQFLSSLGSDRTIVVQKSLNLTDETDHVVKLYGYKNLTIKGINSSIRLSVSKEENLVLYVDSCENFSLSNLIMGHEKVLRCFEGVLMFNKCTGVNISNCDIYGCGYYGIVFDYTNNVNCTNSTIHNCHVDLLEINNSNNVNFKNTILKESVMGTMISVYSSSQVQFDNCSFIDDTHTGENMYGHKCFSLNCDITLKNCSINYTNTYGDTKHIKDVGCKWISNNQKSNIVGKDITIKTAPIIDGDFKWELLSIQFEDDRTVLKKKVSVINPAPDARYTIWSDKTEYIEDSVTGMKYYIQSSSLGFEREKTFVKNVKYFDDIYPKLPSNVMLINIYDGSRYVVQNFRIR